MITLKDIYTVVQNELLSVSNQLNQISHCVFPDDAEITLKYKENNVKLLYSEARYPDVFGSCLSVTFSNLKTQDFDSKENLALKLQNEIVELINLNSYNKLVKDFEGLSTSLSEENKIDLLNKKEIRFILKYNEFNNLDIIGDS